MDVARFNFSHGTHKDHEAGLERLRAAAAKKQKAVGALQDLCGPKVRTGSFPAPFLLPTGAEVTLVEGDQSSDERVIPIQYEGLAGDVRAADRILFDDGRIILVVKSITGGRLVAQIEGRCAITSAYTSRARRCASAR
jgi:pyruvate kinase